MCAAISSQKTKIYRGIIDPYGVVVWGKVNGVSSFSGPNAQKQKTDVTPLGAKSAEYVYGVREEGDFSLTMAYDPGDPIHHKIITQDIVTEESAPWRLVLSEGTRVEFMGNVSGTSLSGGVDDIIRWTLNISITGEALWS